MDIDFRLSYPDQSLRGEQVLKNPKGEPTYKLLKRIQIEKTGNPTPTSKCNA